MLNRMIWCALIALTGVLHTSGQDLPRCSERLYIVQKPLADPDVWCIERPLQMQTDELTFSALTFMPDGTLYTLAPLSGELYRLRDSDGDALPDTPEVVAGGMNRPLGMAPDGDALYIVGDGVLYRYQSGELATLLDDLPGGRGLSASGIAVHAGVVYIGIPMPCDFCEGDDERHGTILRYDPASTETRIVARGLRYPAALTWYNGQLWVGDTARDGLYFAHDGRHWIPLDELNAFDPEQATMPHFGFPYCVGNNQPDLQADFDCEQATPPVFFAPTQSTPYALVPYQGAAIPHLRGDLLIALAGGMNNSQIRGFQVSALDPTRTDGRIQIEVILPSAPALSPVKPVDFYDLTGMIVNEHAERLSQIRQGIYPYRVAGLAVSVQGWIYTLAGDGNLYVLRPNDYDLCGRRDCE